MQTRLGLCASQWFGVASLAIAFHVRVILFGPTEQGLLSPVAHGVSVAQLAGLPETLNG